MIEVKDEILNGSPRYRIRDEKGNIILDNLTIEMTTPIIEKGTELNKALFNGIKNDIEDRLKIEDKATEEEAKLGTDDIKYMTALKTFKSILENAKPSNFISIKTGTISHNAVIPQTVGFNNYIYFVSISDGSLSKSCQSQVGTDIHGIAERCSVDKSTRKVTCQLGFTWCDSTTYGNATANYIEIAWN